MRRLAACPAGQLTIPEGLGSIEVQRGFHEKQFLDSRGRTGHSYSGAGDTAERLESICATGTGPDQAAATTIRAASTGAGPTIAGATERSAGETAAIFDRGGIESCPGGCGGHRSG